MRVVLVTTSLRLQLVLWPFPPASSRVTRVVSPVQNYEYNAAKCAYSRIPSSFTSLVLVSVYAGLHRSVLRAVPMHFDIIPRHSRIGSVSLYASSAADIPHYWSGVNLSRLPGGLRIVWVHTHESTSRTVPNSLCQCSPCLPPADTGLESPVPSTTESVHASPRARALFSGCRRSIYASVLLHFLLGGHAWYFGRPRSAPGAGSRTPRTRLKHIGAEHLRSAPPLNLRRTCDPFELGTHLQLPCPFDLASCRPSLIRFLPSQLLTAPRLHFHDL
ncbi:hypothetical protein B0H11DRAFT_2355801 [Mycena galericulata]|nr:hypothetical protein B0H11DRAFT_2355801 [Mycena galericulata]